MPGTGRREDGVHSCVVGLGYVGLTLSIHLDRAGYETVGYDIDERRIAELRRNHDPSGEFGDDAIEESQLLFTDSPEVLRDCSYVHVALPTPIKDDKNPDLSSLSAACETIGRHITDGTIIVFESTLYPGATREVLRPAVERGAAARDDVSFSIGYSPERVVPAGNRPFSELTKVVSAEDETTLKALGDLYGSIVDAGIYYADSIEAAEASKCLENVQRDVNIGLINEFVLGCQHLDFDLDPRAVLEAARTKWNFHDYRPGIVGGHCIPVDPNYLRYKFEESGFRPNVLRSARAVNEQMVDYVCSITVDGLCQAKARRQIVGDPTDSIDTNWTEGSLPENISGSRILLLGFSYKPNVSDLRNSGVGEIADVFIDLGLEVSGFDPFHDFDSVPESYNFDIAPRLDFEGIDATVLLTPHREFVDLDVGALSRSMNDDSVLVEVGDQFDPAEVAAHGITYRRL